MNYKAAYEKAMAECTRLEKEIEEKDKTIEEKDKTIAEKDRTIEEQNKIIEEDKLTIEHLREMLFKRNKMLFGRKSEKNKYLSPDEQPVFEGGINEAESESDLTMPEPERVKTASKVRKSKKTGKHRGRNELRSDLETKKVVYELPENERICEVCGDTLEQYAEEHICTRIFTIPEQIYKVEYYRAVYKCKNCDKNAAKSNIVKAPNKTPAAVIPKGLPDASLVADIMQRKYQLGEPLYRQEQYWKLRGIYLNRTSLANWVIKGAEWFEPVIKKFWEYAWLEPILNADETPLNVLKKGKTPLTKKGQMWVVCTGAVAERKIALYSYRDSRTKATAEELLKGYTGTVQTDGMASYGSGEYVHAGCWAHARRKFVDCIPKGDTTCKSAQIVELLDKAAKLEREARTEKYSKSRILEMRQNEVKPLIEKVYEIIDGLKPGKNSNLGTAVTYAQNQKEKLLVFLNDPNVEMTNNLAERTVKPLVINRKNFLFCDTDKGADASADVMSIIETAKRNGLDVYGYLLYLLTKLPEWGDVPTDEQLETVMPWSSELPEYCRQMYSEIQ